MPRQVNLAVLPHQALVTKLPITMGVPSADGTMGDRQDLRTLDHVSATRAHAAARVIGASRIGQPAWGSAREWCTATLGCDAWT
jgi:hypothetical protein